MNYIIFDLEATCWENDKSKSSEIIEIGAVKLTENLEIIDVFSTFVKPSIHPVLSEFCTELTSITQGDVDPALNFKEAMEAFESWIGLEGASVLLCSWGYYDKGQIISECAIKGYSGNICRLLNQHMSLKHRFAEVRNIKPCGMKRALDLLELPLEGIHHRGIDDAKNIAKIFKKAYNELKL